MTSPVTCPYCNSLVTVTPGMSGGQRLACPRCGESFALLTTDSPAANGIAQQPAPAVALAPRFQGNRWILNKPFQANRRTALILLGVMGFMAAGSLALALATQSFRRDNDKGIVKTNPKRRPPLDSVETNDATPTSPAKLAALSWLPRDTSLVVGVHVRELVASPAGKSLLTQPLNISGVTIQVDKVAVWTGFKIDEIDHLVLGARGDSPIPLPLLVVNARQEYDEAELVRRLDAHRAGSVGERPVYRFKPHEAPGLLSELFVCCVDARTVVYAIVKEHLNEIPAEPRTDLGQLASPVRDVLQERVRTGGPLWIAGHSDEWAKTMLFKGLFKPQEDKERARRLSKVTTFAAWVRQPEDPVVVEAVFRCGDDRAAQDLQKYLEVPEVGVDPDLKAAVNGGWLTVQKRLSLKNVRDYVERLKP